MSKVKLTPEEQDRLSELVGRGKGDPDVHGYPGQTDEPSQADWSINDLHTAIDRLEVSSPWGYVKELREASNRLHALIKILEKPF